MSHLTLAIWLFLALFLWCSLEKDSLKSEKQSNPQCFSPTCLYIMYYVSCLLNYNMCCKHWSQCLTGWSQVSIVLTFCCIAMHPPASYKTFRKAHKFMYIVIGVTQDHVNIDINNKCTERGCIDRASRWPTSLLYSHWVRGSRLARTKHTWSLFSFCLLGFGHNMYEYLK